MTETAVASRQHEIGFVIEATQYVLTLDGLPSAAIGDILAREDGSRALVQSLADDRVIALALDPTIPRSGDRYGFLPEQHFLSLGTHLFGRIISPLGEPVDGGAAFPAPNAKLDIDVEAPGIEVRAPIIGQLKTGITLIDTLLPIAKGQRQLLFGPVRGGKTDFLADIVRNQEGAGTICIYTLIGKSLSELERIERLILSGRGGQNIIIAALSDEPAPAIALAPAVSLLVADYFMRQGKDVLVVLDDLDLHAKYLREIALLENRLPGRESYPGDLFYEHARILERAGRFAPSYGGGSITVLPVIETDPYESLGIVSTNLMACTDGHLAFANTLQAEGIYPAIEDDQSITRIGRNSQSLLQRQLSSQIRLLLAEARRQRQYTQFGAAVGKEMAEDIRMGEVIEALLHQSPGMRIATELQVPLLALALTSLLREHDGAFALRNKGALIQALATNRDLKPLVDASATDTPLDAYVPQVESKRAIFQSVCRA